MELCSFFVYQSSNAILTSLQQRLKLLENYFTHTGTVPANIILTETSGTTPKIRRFVVI